MAMLSYDVIIAGLGVMGSAAARELARQGLRVLGLDAHPRGHRLGASHGRTRFIREALYERPEYVQLVLRSYAKWRELEAESGQTLLEITGGLWLGPRDARIVSGSLESAQRHGLRHELLDPDALARAHPAFALPPDTWGLYEPNAGVLLPEACVAAQLASAESHGAVLRHGEAVRSWRAEGDHVIVNGAYQARSLILTTGPWIRELTGLPVEPHRVLLLHAEPASNPSRFARIPLWLLDSAPGVFYYGVPYRAGEGMKLGLHQGADASESDAIRYLDVLNRILPGAGGRLLWTEHCWYAMSPDCDFFVDRHPRYPNVVFGGGFSGHGFKFAPVIGEALAGLAIQGQTPLPIGFLSVRRIVEAHELESGVDKQDVAGNAPSQVAR